MFSVSLVLCGEGPSDFGTIRQLGPLAELSQLLIRDYFNRDCIIASCVYKRKIEGSEAVQEHVKCIGRRMSLARTPAQIRLRATAEKFANTIDSTQGQVGLVHSDVDYTNQSAGNSEAKARKALAEYEAVYDALSKGIESAGKKNCCCPVVPRPRTEAWFLYLIPECQFSSQKIELLKGNDNAEPKNNAKKLLKEYGYVMSSRCGRNERSVCELLKDASCFEKLKKLSSFEKFCSDLSRILENAQSA